MRVVVHHSLHRSRPYFALPFLLLFPPRALHETVYLGSAGGILAVSMVLAPCSVTAYDERETDEGVEDDAVVVAQAEPGVRAHCGTAACALVGILTCSVVDVELAHCCDDERDIRCDAGGRWDLDWPKRPDWENEGYK